jgi:hypothetical protein
MDSRQCCAAGGAVTQQQEERLVTDTISREPVSAEELEHLIANVEKQLAQFPFKHYAKLLAALLHYKRLRTQVPEAPEGWAWALLPLTTRCPHCEKCVKPRGLSQHIRAMHPPALLAAAQNEG